MDTKWFKLEIQITGETVTLLPGEAKEKNEAVTDFHTAMGSLRASVDAGNLDGATCMVLNTDGGVDRDHCEHYPDPVPVTPPEPEPGE